MATPEQLTATMKALGLDQPIHIQYVDWIVRLARGDMGISLTTKQPVAVLIGEALRPTLWLLAGAMTVALVVGFGLGTWAAATRSRWIEMALGALMSVLYGAPAVWVGLVAILVFAVRMHWLPPAGFEDPLTHPLEGVKALLLPSLVLGLSIGGIEARFVRSALGEAMAQDFARVVRAKGSSRIRVLLVHAARNGLIPVITTYALNFAYLLGGSVVIEVVFTWPGIGNLLENSITSTDYPTVQALLMIFVTTFAIVNLATDITYGLVDPRIQRGQAGAGRAN
jgi:ABC-type dipeptide/oligopeptide/nickel transport system permease component